MNRRAVVLLSAGLDSAYNLFEAHRELNIIKVLTFDYGQRAAQREKERSAELCQSLRLEHQVIELPWFRQFTQTALVNAANDVPVGDTVLMQDLQRSHETARAVWVPNRNGIFLNIGAGFAEGLGADWLITGFNIEEAATFPDNSAQFISALSESLSFSTANSVQVKSFCVDMNKSEIVERSIKLGVPFDRLWPCYFSDEKICGVCESCQRFMRALLAQGILPPPTSRGVQ